MVNGSIGLEDVDPLSKSHFSGMLKVHGATLLNHEIPLNHHSRCLTSIQPIICCRRISFFIGKIPLNPRKPTINPDFLFVNFHLTHIPSGNLT